MYTFEARSAKKIFRFKKMDFTRISSPMRLVLLLLLHTWSYTYVSTNDETSTTSSTSANTSSTSNISSTLSKTVETSTTTPTHSATQVATVNMSSATTPAKLTTTTSPTTTNTNTATTSSTTQAHTNQSSQATLWSNTTTTTANTSSATVTVPVTTTDTPTTTKNGTATTSSTTQAHTNQSSQTTLWSNTTTTTATVTVPVTTTDTPTTTNNGTDINECNGNHTCHTDANCTNTHSGFNCTCRPGFTGNGIYCTDINECNGNHTCHTDANCTNTHGGFNCTCRPGFTGNGNYCTDINECNGNHACHTDANCTNTHGSFNCTCRPGFTGNGNYCTDINECNGNHTCHTDANCTNTHGGFNCTCRPGFTGNGNYCTDINECNDNRTCHAYANCTNTQGSYNCTCKEGFSGNETYCTDVDECENKTICDDFTKYCVNSNGNYSCKCKPAYYMDENLKCQLAKFSYVGYVTINVITTNRTELLIELRDWLNMVFTNISGSLEYIEILTTNDTAYSRYKRQARSEKLTYILHTKEEIKHGYLESMINECNSTCINKHGNKSFTVDGGIDIANESVLCKLRGNCDPFSTVCNATNGRPECDCKTGFERKPNTVSDQFCTDKNECEDAHQKCKNSKDCINTNGNWTCICENGFEETALNDFTRTCTDKCISNPCKNGAKCEHGNGAGLVYCRCTSNWVGPYCEEANPQTSSQESSEASKFRTILIAVGASLGSICFLLLIVTCRVCRRKQSRKHPELRPLSTHMNDYEMNENKGTYQIPRAHVSNGDDRHSKMEDKQSTHQIPRAQVGNRDERLYDEIEGGRELNVLDERSIKQDKLEREPLTKSIKESHGGGAENRSFLHEEAERRRSENPGKNGVDYF